MLAGAFLLGLVVLATWTALSGTPPGDVQLLPCPLQTLSGLRCPGCGITRACLALARGEFAAAWSYHPFAYLLVPLALTMGLAPGKTRRAWRRVPETLRRMLVGAALAACLILWLARTF